MILKKKKENGNESEVIRCRSCDLDQPTGKSVDVTAHNLIEVS